MIVYILSLILCFNTALAVTNIDAKHHTEYPDFKDNPYLTSKMRDMMKPHLLPLDSPLKPILDSLFSSGRVLQDENTLQQAGFVILHSMPSSYVKVVRHDALPGYLFKFYLDNQVQLKKDKPGWWWLTNRCIGAERIRKMIEKKHMRHFAVPDKWLYIVPSWFPTAGPTFQPVVLVETDMNLESHDMILYAWYHLATRRVLDELFYILDHGAGSYFLSGNIPYTKSGKFAFIDTEYPKRDIKMKKVKRYLNPEMQAYWDYLMFH
jgi:hypothetical protein